MATPEVAGRMLFEALTEARLASLPEQHDDLRSFVELELAQVVHETLGPDAVAMIHERIELVLRVLARIELHRHPNETNERPSSRPVRVTPRAVPRAETSSPGLSALALRPIPSRSRGDATLEIPSDMLASARSGPSPATRPPPSGPHTVEPSLRTERETRPPPSGSHVLPSTGSISATRVVLVTADARLGSTLRVHLGATATVLTYRTLTELARSPIGSVQLLLLDVRDLPRDAELGMRPASVLLWPASIAERDRFASKHPHLADVRFAGQDASAEDIASVIALTLAR